MEIKISKKLISLMVAGGISVAPVGGITETNNYQEGSFIEITEENSNYGQYVVMKDDNLSRISMKICGYFGKDMTTKYWPAIAFLNNYPRVINPGDIIVFPSSFEALVELNNNLRKVGWTARYIQSNNIYKVKEKEDLPRKSLEELLYDIYGDKVCVDEDFIRLYLRAHNLDDDYELSDSGEFDNEMLFKLTEWIPTLSELEEYSGKKKSK